MRLRHLAALGFVAAALPANASGEFEPQMRAFLEAEIRPWAQSDVIVDAIRAQNRERANLSAPDISAMDGAWRAEIGSASTPTITPVLENAAADFLREQVTASMGTITEVFIMDRHGLNVAASSMTSDMWQGDEAKFQETFPAGAEGVHFSEIELDESTQSYQGQISITIVDPATGQPIGAMTVGVNAEALL